MAPLAHIIVLALLLLPVSAEAAPGIGSKLFSVYTGTTPNCGAIPCIWADSSIGLIKFRSAAGVDLRVGEMDRVTQSASDPGGPVGGQCVYNTTVKRVRCYQDSAWAQLGDTATIGGAPAEAFFSRTCTLTSAAALTPVPCLADADVPAGKAAYLIGWHAKVNGSTPWSTTTTCWIRDTGGTSTNFIAIAVAALTGNAFVGDHSANVSQGAPYSQDLGGTSDLGIEIACDAAGSGSPLVVTVFGVIK